MEGYLVLWEGTTCCGRVQRAVGGYHVQWDGTTCNGNSGKDMLVFVKKFKESKDNYNQSKIITSRKIITYRKLNNPGNVLEKDARTDD